MICNANVYSAFLEGKATKDEMRAILKKMMRDSRLMMKLNLAATVSSIKTKEKDNFTIFPHGTTMNGEC